MQPFVKRLAFAATFAITANSGTAQVASNGCGLSASSNGVYQFDAIDARRSFRLHLPSNYDPKTPAPLVLAFHGWGADEDTLLDYRVVRRQANRMGAIIAAPAGLGSNEDRPGSWTAFGSSTGLDGDGVNPDVPGDTAYICNPDVLEDETYPSCGSVPNGTAKSICSWTQCQSDDVRFVDDLLTQLEDTLCIDKSRIFAAGTSNGGMFVWDLAQDARLARRLKAIAPIIGLPDRGNARGPVNDADLPVLMINGLDDPIVPPGDWGHFGFTTSSDGFEYYYTSASAMARAWATARGCQTQSPPHSVDVGVRGLDSRSHCSAPDNAEFPPVLDCRMNANHDAKLRRTWPLVMRFFADQPAAAP